MTTHRGGLAPNKYLTPDELQDVRDFIRIRTQTRKSRRSKTDHLIIEILSGSGVRASELIDLRIEDLPGHHKKPVLYIRDGKGGVSRAVDISTSLCEHIAEYVAEFRTEAPIDNTLFCNPRGKPTSYRALHRKIQGIGEDMGLPARLHCHKFRHSFAIKLYGLEHDLLFVSSQLGHSDVNTTCIYAQTSPEASRRQMENF